MTAITRRGIIQGLGGLAALAVIPSTRRAIPLGQQDLFVRLAKKNGVVRDAEFLLDGPIVLTDISNLVVERTIFRASHRFPAGEPMLHISGTCSNFKFVKSTFISSPPHSGGAFSWAAA